MFKTPEGGTMHDTTLCIGCRRCQRACPYSARELGPESLDGATYSVNSFNPEDKPVQAQWAETTAIIPGCTSAPADVAKACGTVTPTLNAFVEGDMKNVRDEGVIEKCTFCYHRTSNGGSSA